MTPTGTNLLGLVKHVAGIESGYLGEHDAFAGGGAVAIRSRFSCHKLISLAWRTTRVRRRSRRFGRPRPER
jgi:hypothetical protein